MSYCVNCGVELDKSAKKCALCDTPVYNPNEKATAEPPSTPFSQTAVIPKGVKKRFIALIISFIILIPNIVCFFVNMFFLEWQLWFVYVLATSVLVWVMFVFPFFSKKLHPYLMWGFDSVAVALYVFVCYGKSSIGGKWYLVIALPVIVAVSLCVWYFIYWSRQRKRHWTSEMLHIFIDLVVTFTVLGVSSYIYGALVLCECAIIIDLCCFALTFFFLYANKSKRVRAWLAKKMFV